MASLRPTTTGSLPTWSSPTPSERHEVVTKARGSSGCGITRCLDREGVPTVTDSTTSARDRYHKKEPRCAVRATRVDVLSRSLRPILQSPPIHLGHLPGLAPGGRCKIIGEVFTEDVRLFDYPVHLSGPESGADTIGAKAATSGRVRANVGDPCSVVSKWQQVCHSS
jgi:hypothetical protein